MIVFPRLAPGTCKANIPDIETKVALRRCNISRLEKEFTAKFSDVNAVETRSSNTRCVEAD